MKSKDPHKPNAFKRFWRNLGPGLVTGASDDDPSGIATYTQAGAMFGLSTLWTAIVAYPMMVGIQEMCARIGIVTREGLTGVLKKHYPRPLLYLMVLFSVPAIIINIGANIQAMGAVTNMLFPAFEPYLASIIFTALLLVLMIFLPYRPIASALKYLCLSLLLYMLVPFWVKLDWLAVLKNTFIPSIKLEKNYLLILVAIFGTTVSPYLFFWQTSMEVEEANGKTNSVMVDKKLISNMQLDVDFGMFLTCIVFFFIILSTGTVLFNAGLHNVTTVKEAATALRPIVGDKAYWFFALGVIGTGLLSIPVLAGAVSYILSESFGWKEGLDKKWHEAPGFYFIMAAALVMGLLFDFIGISTMKALFYAAILYGLTAPVLIGLLLHIANNKAIMGSFVNSRRSNFWCWTTFILMTIAAGLLVFYMVV